MDKEIQKFLLHNGYDDVVVNARRYSENTKENARKWVYVSDVIKHFISERQTSTEFSEETDSKARRDSL